MLNNAGMKTLVAEVFGEKIGPEKIQRVFSLVDGSKHVAVLCRCERKVALQIWISP